jgi:hypothetical protein
MAPSALNASIAENSVRNVAPSSVLLLGFLLVRETGTCIELGSTPLDDTVASTTLSDFGATPIATLPEVFKEFAGKPSFGNEKVEAEVDEGS